MLTLKEASKDKQNSPQMAPENPQKEQMKWDNIRSSAHLSPGREISHPTPATPPSPQSSDQRATQPGLPGPKLPALPLGCPTSQAVRSKVECACHSHPLPPMPPTALGSLSPSYSSPRGRQHSCSPCVSSERENFLPSAVPHMMFSEPLTNSVMFLWAEN